MLESGGIQGGPQALGRERRPLPQDGGTPTCAEGQSRGGVGPGPSPSWTLSSSLCPTSKTFVLHLECCILA